MAKTRVVQEGFRRFISDAPREALPKGAVYRMTDWIPQGSESRKRGGWGVDSIVLAGSSSVSGLAWAPFKAGGELLAVGDTGKIYLSSLGLMGAGTGQASTHKPFWHRDRMIVLGNLFDSAATPHKVYDSGGYVEGVVGGTPPQARAGCSWGDYLFLLNYYDPSDGGALKNYRGAWSSVGDPDTWVYSGTNASTWDFDAEALTAMRLRNLTLVWGYENVWILTGDTPPPGGNLALSRTLDFGTFDSRSVARYKDQAIFANSSGVWMTDGASEIELTNAGGISTYYREVFASAQATGIYVVTAEVIYNYYVLTLSSQGTEITTIVCDLEDYSWFGWSNFPAAMYAHRASGASLNEELFMASGATATVGTIASCFELGNIDETADGNGNDVEPSFETGFFLLSDSKAEKRVRRAYFTYFLGSEQGSDATFTVSYALAPYASGYTVISPALAVNTQLDRVALDVRQKATGIAFKVIQTNNGDDIYDSVVAAIEVEGHEMEPSR